MSLKSRRGEILRVISRAFASFPGVRRKVLQEAYRFPVNQAGVQRLAEWMLGLVVQDVVAELSTSGAELATLVEYVKVHDLDDAPVRRLEDRLAEAYHWAMTSPDAVVTFEPYSVGP